MSATISFSDQPDRVWMVKNSLYAWFVELVSQGSVSSTTHNLLRMSEFTNGIVIDVDADTFRELVSSLLAAAGAVADGSETPPLDRTVLDIESVRALFAELVALLAERAEGG